MRLCHSWVWVNTYRYIFSGMNIHLPAILMWTTGVPGFWPIPTLLWDLNAYSGDHPIFSKSYFWPQTLLWRGFLVGLCHSSEFDPWDNPTTHRPVSPRYRGETPWSCATRSACGRRPRWWPSSCRSWRPRRAAWRRHGDDGYHIHRSSIIGYI